MESEENEKPRGMVVDIESTGMLEPGVKIIVIGSAPMTGKSMHELHASLFGIAQEADAILVVHELKTDIDVKLVDTYRHQMQMYNPELFEEKELPHKEPKNKYINKPRYNFKRK